MGRICPRARQECPDGNKCVSCSLITSTDREEAVKRVQKIERSENYYPELGRRTASDPNNTHHWS